MAKAAVTVRDIAAAFGALGGRARAKKLTKAQRQEIARMGGKARWSSKRKGGQK